MDISREQTLKKRSMDYDGIAKEYLQRLSDKAIIAFINSVFKRDFPSDSRVLKLNKEDNLENGRRLADTYIHIKDEIFHIEVQTDTDKSISLRMFEYGFAAAVQHGSDKSGGSLRLKFPEPTIIYLRSTRNTPDKLTVELLLPNNKSIDFDIPVLKMKDFDIETLIEKSMYPIIPFNAMKYETGFNEDNFLSDLEYLSAALIKRIDSGELLAQEAKDIIKKSFDIAQNVAESSRISNFKEVVAKMENINRVEVTDILGMLADYEKKGEARGEARGKARGKAEGKAEVVVNMIARNKGMSEVIDITGLSEEQILKIQEKNFNLIKERKAQFEEKQRKAAEKNRNAPPIL